MAFHSSMTVTMNSQLPRSFEVKQGEEPCRAAAPRAHDNALDVQIQQPENEHSGALRRGESFGQTQTIQQVLDLTMR